MDSPGTEKRKMYAKQPKLQRNSVAPAPAANFGRSAAGHASSASYSPRTDGLRRQTSESVKDVLTDASGATPLVWCNTPTNVFVIKKFRDRAITTKFKEITRFLVEEKELNVFVERAVLAERDVQNDANFAKISPRLTLWSSDDADCDEKLAKIDFIVCLGGDGTLLHVSSLYQKSVPPILAFRLGSLGFLTPLDVGNYQQIINQVIEGTVTLTLRSRLECVVIRARRSSSSPASNGVAACYEQQSSTPSPTAPIREPLGALTLGKSDVPEVFFRRSNSVITSSTQTSHMLVLNEVVIDRGQSAYLSNLQMCCNGRPVTDVQGDGLIVATPTGSTAYAAAAGASMVHPSVQAMVVTPICPHSLSFRPIMVPGGVKIEVKVPKTGRGTGAVSCDGKNRQELGHGDSVQISMSIYPLPCVDGADHMTDWFTSLSSCLHWNARTAQKQFDTEEEDNVETIAEE